MLFRIRDILPVIAPYVRGTGVDITCDAAGTMEALGVYNRINELFMNDQDFPGTEFTVRFPAHDGVIVLPERFEKIKELNIDGYPAHIFPVGWQFLEAGPGEHTHAFDIRCIRNLGTQFPTSRELPSPLPLFAVSDAEEAKGAAVLVTGYDASNKFQRCSIPVGKASATRSPRLSKVFSSITAVSKPVTGGHIDLGAWSDVNGPYWLSRMEPRDQSPCYTRYHLPHLNFNAALQRGQCHTVTAMVSLRFNDIYDLDGVSPVQHREAYRYAAQACNAFDDSSFQIGSGFMGKAMSLLKGKAAKLDQGQRKALNISVSRRLTSKNHSNRRFR